MGGGERTELLTVSESREALLQSFTVEDRFLNDDVLVPRCFPMSETLLYYSTMTLSDDI